MTGEVPRFHPLGTQGVLVTLGEAIAIDLSGRIGSLTDRLDTLHLAGVEDIVPSYTTVTLLGSMSPVRWTALTEIVRALWRDIATAPLAETARRMVEIPVAYGGEHGPDLAAVAAHTGLSESEIVRRHSDAGYVVGALGFAPGFAFLTGLPPDLATPRRAQPRTAVPVGSVGIGGAQTGVYALPTPGGWSLIGRTPERLFDPHRAEPFTLRMGDRVRFQPIPASAFRVVAPAVTVPPDRVRRPAIAVVSPGLQTTVQDLGRPGMGRLGVTPGGAADRGALIRGNRRVGNADAAAALELTIAGPHLRMLRPLRIALSGADLGAHLNGQRLPAGAVRVVRPGDELTFDPGQALRGSGARAYLCVRGGIDAPVVLGSRSTDLMAALGGLDGRPLRAGDVLAVGGALPSTTHEPTRPVRVDRRQPLRIVPGPQADRFDAGAWKRLLTATWVVGPQSNRVGLRLEGPPLVPVGGADVISEGMVTGAIQITGIGQPIVMGPARATVGGYARIATVIAADLDRLGQLRPGDRVRFDLDEGASGDS